VITKVTSENKGLYKALFEKASGVLGLTGNQTIDSLDKYFSVLKELVEEHSGDSGLLPFGLLPLDEPTFDINADTRVITVPSDFKKNGISVKGDHYAEILYFTINRYFDTTDLYADNIKIIIQWEDPNGKKGVSLAVFRDVSILASQNKMLFGWALTDNITHASGNVKFSVRFYEVDGNNDLSYSLSTLTTSALVNPGLDYQFENGEIIDEIPVYAEDAEHLLNRVSNQEIIYVDPSDIPEEATWVINLPAPSGEELERVDLENDECSFIVKAESEQGVVTYTWKWIPTGSAEPRSPIGEVGDVYVLAQGAYDDSETYYQQVGADGVEGYAPFTDYESGTTIEDEVYIKRNGLTVSHHGPSEPAIIDDAHNPHSITGEYYVIANNRIGLGTSTVESNHVVIPGPDALTVTVPAAAANSVLLSGASDAAGNATLRAQGHTEADGDTITYTWNTVYVEDDVEHLIPIADASHTVTNGIEDTYSIPEVAQADRASFDKTYVAQIKANRNGDSTVDQLFRFRVTDAAHEPTVLLTCPTIFVDGSHKAMMKATVTNANSIAHDEFIYHWYRYSVDEDAGETIEHFQVLNDTELDAAIASAESFNEFEIDAAGSYYCTVATVVNGSTSTVWVPSGAADLIKLQPRS